MNILSSRLLIVVTEEKGFGFDFNPLETNLVNLVILIGVLIYFGRKTIGNILTERSSKIAQAIQEAEEKQKAAMSALTQEQEKLKSAESQAQQIIQAAQSRAETAKLEIAQQAALEVERLQETAVKDLSNEQERVLTALRQRIAGLAVAHAESYLKTNLDNPTQETLLERSIAQIEG